MDTIIKFSILISLLIASCLSEVDFEKFDECKYDELSTDDPTIPKFAKDFEIRTEVKSYIPRDEDSNSSSYYSLSFESVGYYQYDKSRGATIITQGGDDSRFLYDFKTGSAFHIFSKTKYYCGAKQNLYDTACKAFAFYIAEEAGFEDIKTKCGMTAKKSGYDKEYKETIRGIDAQKWQQCLYLSQDNGSYWKLEYFYTRNKSMITAGGNSVVPLRLNITRLDKTDPAATNMKYRELYDFFFYRDRIEDESVFNPPPGVNCRGWVQAGAKEIPKLPEHFSMATMSVSDKDSSRAMNTRLTFDQTKNMVMFLTDDSEPWIFPQKSVKALDQVHTIVHDFNTGLAFDLVGAGDKCLSVKKIDINDPDVHSQTTGESKNISMILANELFTMEGLKYTYIGMRKKNDADVHTWTATRNFSSHEEDKANVDVYFYESTGPDGKPYFRPAGVDVFRFDSNFQELKEKITSTVSFYSEDLIYWKTFDVSTCLRNQTKEEAIYVEFDFNNLKTEDAKNYPNTVGFHNALHQALGKFLNISILRISDLSSQGYAANGTIHVYFTLLGWIDVEGLSSLEKKSEDAFRSFVNSTKGADQPLKLEFITWKDDFTIGQNSVRNISETLFRQKTTPDTPFPSPSTGGKSTGYTGGSMAVLALAMLAIGSIAGVVAGFMLWKRHSGVPYQIYD